MFKALANIPVMDAGESLDGIFPSGAAQHRDKNCIANRKSSRIFTYYIIENKTH